MTIIDVSRHNGPIVWPKVNATGVTVAVIRCSLGSTGVDDRYAANWAQAKAAGISTLAAYHYVITGVSAKGQVDNILRVTGSDFGNEPMTIDCERTEAERLAGNFPRVAYTALVREIIDRLTPIVPVRIYTSAVEWQAMTTLPSWGREFVKWIAQYNLVVTEPDLPFGITTWERWQYWNKGKVDGISGDVDLNRDNVTVPVPPPPDDDDSALKAAIRGHATAITGLVGN